MHGHQNIKVFVVCYHVPLGNGQGL